MVVNKKRTGGDTETHKVRGTQKLTGGGQTDRQTDRVTERCSYRSGAHLTLINARGGCNHPPLSENCDCSGTECLIDLKPGFKFKFVHCLENYLRKLISLGHNVKGGSDTEGG